MSNCLPCLFLTGGRYILLPKILHQADGEKVTSSPSLAHFKSNQDSTTGHKLRRFLRGVPVANQMQAGQHKVDTAQRQVRAVQLLQ